MLVGVFPESQPSRWPSFSLPHARGGVSINHLTIGLQGKSSPCSWGCFQFLIMSTRHTQVFPMLVGVFLRPLCQSCLLYCLPHARGGVSTLPLLIYMA